MACVHHRATKLKVLQHHGQHSSFQCGGLLWVLKKKSRCPSRKRKQAPPSSSLQERSNAPSFSPNFTLHISHLEQYDILSSSTISCSQRIAVLMDSSNFRKSAPRVQNLRPTPQPLRKSNSHVKCIPHDELTTSVLHAAQMTHLEAALGCGDEGLHGQPPVSARSKQRLANLRQRHKPVTTTTTKITSQLSCCHRRYY